MNELLAGGIQSPPFATLIFSVAAALLCLATEGYPPSIRKTGVRILPAALLAILVILYDGPTLLIVALLFAAAGDALMVQGHVRAFVSGLGAFLASRVTLAVMFVLAASPVHAQAEPWRIVVVAVLMLAVGLTVPRLWPYSGPLKWPLVVYSIALVIMAAAASLVPPALILAGIVLIVVSDLMMGTERFLLPTDRKSPLWISRMTWLARYAGLAVIAFVALGLI
jgi:uncharacterized membrane protein YhhN